MTYNGVTQVFNLGEDGFVLIDARGAAGGDGGTGGKGGAWYGACTECVTPAPNMFLPAHQ